ncbi:MAG TPA: sodium-dependent transporter [Firmicutes bacterium]|nr:sodium-dependent transporter [Bacillota bacterium]
MSQTVSSPRDGFTSRFGIIAAAAGSAVGLGNIWKFPYIVGENGGSAFILVYLLCIALVGVPVLLSEFIIGRFGQANAVRSFKKAAPGKPWFGIGWMGIIAAFMILGFYTVIAGYTIHYFFLSVTNAFANMTSADITNTFNTFSSSTFLPIVYTLIFIALCLVIVLGGIKDGIEKYSKVLMPGLLGIIVLLVVRAITLPGAEAGIEFLLKPDFSALSASSILEALGHSFFSLSVGMGTMLTYGSYISKKENLTSTTFSIAAADTMIALLAGLAIFPAVFAFNIDPTAGPGLVFITLPNVFLQMQGGAIFGALFFFLLFIAALTSAVSIFEVIISYIIEELNFNRTKAILLAGLTIAFIGALASLSQTPDSTLSLFGLSLFDFMDAFTAKILLPLGGLFIIIFVGFFFNKQTLQEELQQGSKDIKKTMLFITITKFIAPVAIAIVFLYELGII